MSRHCHEKAHIKRELLDSDDDKTSGIPSFLPDNHNFAVNPLPSPTFMQSARPTTDVVRPRALGIHHLKFAVSNLPLSLAWYERVLGGRRLPSLDHVRPDGTRFAVICQMVDWSGLLLELREDAVRALDDKEWDPLTLTVRGRQDLDAWAMWLDICGTKRSPVLTGLRGWVVLFEVSFLLWT